MLEERSSSAILPPRADPLKFNFISDDGREITYRAYIGGAVSEPVFALTVITASPRNQEQLNDLLIFLDQMKAGFRLNLKSSGPPSSHQPVRFRPGSDILIIPELVTLQKGSGNHNAVNFAIETMIGGREESKSIIYGYRERSGSIDHRKHKFRAAGGVPTTTIVKCTGGGLRVTHPRRKKTIWSGHSINLPEEAYIILRGVDDSGNDYYLSGNFNPPTIIS